MHRTMHAIDCEFEGVCMVSLPSLPDRECLLQESFTTPPSAPVFCLLGYPMLTSVRASIHRGTIFTLSCWNRPPAHAQESSCAGCAADRNAQHPEHRPQLAGCRPRPPAIPAPTNPSAMLRRPSHSPLNSLALTAADPSVRRRPTRLPSPAGGGRGRGGAGGCGAGQVDGGRMSAQSVGPDGLRREFRRPGAPPDAPRPPAPTAAARATVAAPAACRVLTTAFRAGPARRARGSSRGSQA